MKTTNAGSTPALLVTVRPQPPGALWALQRHWPEYLIEAAALAFFMMSACAFGVLLFHPASPAHLAMEDAIVRRALMGLAMGTTAIAIIYSPLGKRSGAHMNPAVTLAFLSLGKVERWDAVFYIAAQFAGGIAGVRIADLLLGPPLGNSAVNYVATMPGPAGAGAAFTAELAISFLMMSTILTVSNHRSLSRFTGIFAGALVATFIAVEDPLSGMSMNPARTFGSALSAGDWTGLWVYFIAPPLGMLIAGQMHRLRGELGRVFCAKLNHAPGARCIFRCSYEGLRKQVGS
jgi:aquaporin Z